MSDDLSGKRTKSQPLMITHKPWSEIQAERAISSGKSKSNSPQDLLSPSPTSIESMLAQRAQRALENPQVLIRTDDYPTTHKRNKTSSSGNPIEVLKSHVGFETSGPRKGFPEIRPADASGDTSKLQHVRGGGTVKNQSPWTSFSETRYPINSPKVDPQEKSYGLYEIEINRTALSQFGSNQMSGPDETSNDIIQETNEKFSKKTGYKALPDVDALSEVPNADDPESYKRVARTSGLAENGSKSKVKDFESMTNRMQDIAHTQRDREVLVKGIIPSEAIRRIGLERGKFRQLKSELHDAVQQRTAKNITSASIDQTLKQAQPDTSPLSNKLQKSSKMAEGRGQVVRVMNSMTPKDMHQKWQTLDTDTKAGVRQSALNHTQNNSQVFKNIFHRQRKGVGTGLAGFSNK